MKRIMIAAALVLSAAVSLAQQAAESIEVRVVNIDVVVRDRHGKPVTGLTKEDFEAWDGKKPQQITNLSEVRTEAGLVTTTAGATAPATAAPAAAEVPDELRQRKL